MTEEQVIEIIGYLDSLITTMKIIGVLIGMNAFINLWGN